MSDKFTNLVADIREQVLFMQELGVESLEFDSAQFEMRETTLTETPRLLVQVPKGKPIVSTPARSATAPKESRLSSLPSLTKRPPREPTAPPMPVTKTAEATVLIDVAPTLESTTDTIESI